MSAAPRGPLLLGMGPWPGPSARHVGFAQLRLSHLHEVLSRGGAPVRVVCLEASEASEGGAGGGAEVIHPEDGPPRWVLDPEDPGTADRLAELARLSSCVVSAGPYLPSALAARICGERPLWADLPGDPFAELHAQSLHGELTEARVAEALARALPVLDRADALSVISQRQRLATLGALGARGRLLGPELPRAVHVLPIAWHFPGPTRPPRDKAPGEPLRILCMGALNAWFDEEVLVAGLELFLEREPAGRVDICGGPHPAHPAAAWERVATWAARHPERVALHGWVEGDRLEALLAEAHVGLSLDRPGVEPLLGSRTRVLAFLHAGLEVVATRGTELVDELARARALRPIPPQDPVALAQELLALAEDGTDPERIRRGQAHCARAYAVADHGRVLADWAREPRRIPGRVSPEALLSHRAEHARDELESLLRAPSIRVLNRLHRLLGGRS